MGSSRLPGKTLLPLPLGGAVTLFEQILRRAGRATSVAVVVAALPDSPADDALAAIAQQRGVAVFRGSEEDVLARFAVAAALHQLDVIVRLTGDNPALDPAFVDEAIGAHRAAAADYTISTGLPLGMNIEVIGRAALDAAHAEATAPADREHVTSWLRARPDRFRLQTVALATATPQAAGLRMTVDYASDYALQQVLYTTLGPDFSLSDILDLLARHPWLAAINATNQQHTV